MKTILLAVCLSTLTSAGVLAQSKTPAGAEGRSDKKIIAVVTNSESEAELVSRTNRLTDRMAQQLHLNNYQTKKLRAINREKVARMMEIERQYAANPQKVDDDCRGICNERDRELRRLLSTAQYSDYYEARNDFYTFDKKFLTEPRDNTRHALNQTPYAVPGQTVEIKNSESSPVLKQGK